MKHAEQVRNVYVQAQMWKAVYLNYLLFKLLWTYRRVWTHCKQISILPLCSSTPLDFDDGGSREERGYPEEATSD